MPRDRDWYEEGVLIDQIGHVSSETPAYDMNDEEILAYQAERDRKRGQRIPAGFRADCSTTYWLAGRRPGSWPEVPHFDVPEA